MPTRTKASPWNVARPRHLVVFVLAAAALAFAENASAATFRITTLLYEGAAIQPAAEHRILFDQGLIYDLPQKDSRFVTVYDPAQGSITLLDRTTKVQATIDIDGLTRAAALARAAADTKQKEDLLGLNAQVTDSTRVIGYSISYGKLEYETTTQQPPDPKMATDFGRFTILSSQLNIVRRFGPPAFGKMTLYEHISRRGELPLELTLTVNQRDAVQTFRATHKLERLMDSDRTMIREVRAMMDLYKDVDFEKFPR
ncbi:MAG: hypothetical protein AAGG48_13710 [Planctomycetota bacterium]